MRNCFWQTVILLLLSTITSAHEIRPGYLEIKENADHSLLITWKQPVMGEYAVPLHPTISAGWLTDSLAQISYSETYLVKHWQLPASHAALDGQTIAIEGLEKTITDVFVQILLFDDAPFTYLIKPADPYVRLNLSKPQPPPVWQYVQLGMFHIWSGFDHLLFVFGLLLLVQKRSKLFWTITAFTISHSVTLALATLQIINVPAAFTEAAIALSIAFLGIELVNHYKGKDGFAYRFPWIVSFLFGLLHGLGFASALGDVGLPQNNIPLALLLFNAGVELGQLVFVFCVLLLIFCLHKISYKRKPWQKYIAPYFIGSMAMFWFIERLTIILN